MTHDDIDSVSRHTRHVSYSNSGQKPDKSQREFGVDIYLFIYQE